MNDATLNPTPRWSAVAVEQLHAVGIALRRETLLAAGIVAAVSLLLLWSRLTAEAGEAPSWDFVPGAMFAAALLGAFVPLSVWKVGGPGRRSYDAAMPVDTWRHLLVKNLGGWVWLMVAVSLYMLWVLVVALATGGDIGVAHTQVFLGTPAEAVRGIGPESFATRAHPVPGWQWAVPFTAATVAYLLGSVAALASAHAWRWPVGAFLAMAMLAGISSGVRSPELHMLTNALFIGEYGLGVVLTGSLPVAEPFTSPTGHTVTIPRDVPNRQAWLGATALWMMAATAGVLLAARKKEG